MFLKVVFAFCFIFIASAASAEDCKAISDSAARLACFDKITASKPTVAPKATLVWYKKLALANKSQLFKDPDSLRDVKIGVPYDCSSPLGQRQCICISANGKNSYGGMTGIQTLVGPITPTSIEMSGEMSKPEACGKMEPFPEMNGKR